MTLTPSRLALARKRRGMTLVRLATDVGISTRSLSAYENGGQQPTQNTLRALADALAIPVAFLQAQEIEEIPPDAASFRALSKMTASQRDTACSAGRIAILINDWIEERFRLPPADIPSLPDLDPETAAEVVRARWGLGQSSVSNVIHLLESHGIRIFSLAAGCAEVDAFSLYWRGTPFAFLNIMKSGERGRFDGAHELGHLVLHTEAPRPARPRRRTRCQPLRCSFPYARAQRDRSPGSPMPPQIRSSRPSTPGKSQPWRSPTGYTNSASSPNGDIGPRASTCHGSATGSANLVASLTSRPSSCPKCCACFAMTGPPRPSSRQTFPCR